MPFPDYGTAKTRSLHPGYMLRLPGGIGSLQFGALCHWRAFRDIQPQREGLGGGQMAELSVILEMVRNLGLAVAAFVGIFLAWKRVTAATRQADATLRRRSSHAVVTLQSYSIKQSVS